MSNRKQVGLTRSIRRPLQSRDPNAQPLSDGTKDSGIAGKENESNVVPRKNETGGATETTSFASSHGSDIDRYDPLPTGPIAERSLSALTPAFDAAPVSRKAKNGHAKKPFIPNWYNAKEVYSTTTLYNKIGVKQMETFLKGEGVNIETRYPRSRMYLYLYAGDKVETINRGYALVMLVLKVHQRVIDRKDAGLPVGASTAPHMGAEEFGDDAYFEGTDSEEEPEEIGIATTRQADTIGESTPAADVDPGLDIEGGYNFAGYISDNTTEVDTNDITPQKSFTRLNSPVILEGDITDSERAEQWDPPAHSVTAESPSPLTGSVDEDLLALNPFGPGFSAIATGMGFEGEAAPALDKQQATSAITPPFIRTFSPPPAITINVQHPAENMLLVPLPKFEYPGYSMGFGAPKLGHDIPDTPVTIQTRDALRTLKAELENEASTAANGNGSSQQAPDNRVLRNGRGEVLLSVKIKNGVRRIIAAVNRYHENKRLWEERGIDKLQFVKERDDSRFEYQEARSDLMGYLEDDIVWDLHRGRGIIVAKIVVNVFPTFALKD